MPTGQVLRWQTRAITQPSEIIAIVPKPYSSAPSKAPIITSLPVRKPPSTRKRTRSRKPFNTKAECVSAKPNSQGQPADLMDDSGEAPVPPSPPDIWITSAAALATPQATVPIPIDETSLTETPACSFIACRSCINCARS